jgi:hypothetical protein
LSRLIVDWSAKMDHVHWYIMVQYDIVSWYATHLIRTSWYDTSWYDTSWYDTEAVATLCKTISLMVDLIVQPSTIVLPSNSEYRTIRLYYECMGFVCQLSSDAQPTNWHNETVHTVQHAWWSGDFSAHIIIISCRCIIYKVAYVSSSKEGHHVVRVI